MSRIELMPAVGDDFERIVDHFAEFDATNIPFRLHEIIEAIAVLEHNPLIGRSVNALDDDKRKLVIGRQVRGYGALYRYIDAIDTVLVPALRGQREAGYTNL